MVRPSDHIQRPLSASADISELLRERDPVEKAILRLDETIADFKSGLSAEEEVGIIISTPGGAAIRVQRFSRLNMDLLAFDGVSENGKPQRVIQHVSQLNILLTAFPKLGEEPRGIGFRPPDCATPVE